MRNKTRLQYHYAVRRIDKNNNAIKSERMDQSCLSNKRDMWQEAKKMRGNNSKLPGMVDNVVGDNDISDLFLNKFKSIFTSVGYNNEDMDGIRLKLMNKINEKTKLNCDENHYHEQNVIPDNLFTNILLSDDDVEDALHDLSSGKADGNIGIYSDHLLHGTKLLFNSMIVHGYTPTQMRTGTIIPIVKNKRADVSDSDNF